MEFLNKIQSYLDSLDQKRFYQLVGGYVGALVLISAVIMFNYYRTVRSLKRTIESINEYRQEARTILGKAQHVKRDQKEIDDILRQEPNFKIAQYFEDLISQLKLSNKKASKLEVTVPSSQGKYQETTLNAKLAGMSMQELTELLQEIEQTKRVFTKELEITASRKNSGTIDVNLTIATLEQRVEGEVV